MKAGIAVDDWKLPTFKRRLAEAGYSYAEPALTIRGVSWLTIETDDLAALAEVIKAAQSECAKRKAN